MHCSITVEAENHPISYLSLTAEKDSIFVVCIWGQAPKPPLLAALDYCRDLPLHSKFII